MRAPIAKIRINAGNPGWYDSLTNIHLTITRPEALVYEGSNTTNIKRAVSFGLVHVTEGSLDEEVKIETIAVKKEVVREVAPQVEVKTEEVVTEEVKPVEVQEEKAQAEEVQAEETQEVAKEEVVEEKPKAKKTTKKKSTKKDAE